MSLYGNSRCSYGLSENSSAISCQACMYMSFYCHLGLPPKPKNQVNLWHWLLVQTWRKSFDCEFACQKLLKSQRCRGVCGGEGKECMDVRGLRWGRSGVRRGVVVLWVLPTWNCHSQNEHTWYFGGQESLQRIGVFFFQ